MHAFQRVDGRRLALGTARHKALTLACMGTRVGLMHTPLTDVHTRGACQGSGRTRAASRAWHGMQPPRRHAACTCACSALIATPSVSVRAPPPLPPPPSLSPPSLPRGPGTQVTDYTFFALQNSPDARSYDLSTMTALAASLWFICSVLNLASLILAWMYTFEMLGKEVASLEEEQQVGAPGSAATRGSRWKPPACTCHAAQGLL